MPTKEPSGPSEDEDVKTEPGSQGDDTSMAVDDEVPKVQPKKKKVKKVVPIGKNGLKKKRIEKQKIFMDNGYMGM